MSPSQSRPGQYEVGPSGKSAVCPGLFIACFSVLLPSLTPRNDSEEQLILLEVTQREVLSISQENMSRPTERCISLQHVILKSSKSPK